MFNLFLSCDQKYYSTWTINCIKSIQTYVPWINIHTLIVNPSKKYEKINGVKYYDDFIEFSSESSEIAYYQASRFLKCADIFSKQELVFSIDCDTVCTRSFSEIELEKILKNIHVQRHQKNVRWMAGFVTYGNNNNFRETFKNKLLEVPIDNWRIGRDQTILNELSAEFEFNKLNVGEWMSFGRGNGIFLTLKGDQKTSSGYVSIYNQHLNKIL